MTHDDGIPSHKILIAEVLSRLQLISPPAILVVDDDPINLGLVELLFKRVDIPIDTAIDGVDALDKLAGRGYDLILMDIHMPNMNGLEATRAIRQQAGFLELPIVGLTGADLDRDIELAINAGMSTQIFRPLTLGKLLGALLEYWGTALPTKRPHNSEYTVAPIVSKGASNRIGDLFLLDDFCSEHTAFESLGSDAYLRIVGAFIKDMEHRLPQWQAETAWTRESKKSFAHRIYGTSCALGAKTLAEICVIAESELDAGHDFDVKILTRKLVETLETLQYYRKEQAS